MWQVRLQQGRFADEQGTGYRRALLVIRDTEVGVYVVLGCAQAGARGEDNTVSKLDLANPDCLEELGDNLGRWDSSHGVSSGRWCSGEWPVLVGDS